MNDPQIELDPRQSAQITLRVPRRLKGRAVRCSRRANRKLSPWLIEAIKEKCDREEPPDGLDRQGA